MQQTPVELPRQSSPMQQPQDPQASGVAGVANELKSDAQRLGSTAADRIHSEVDNRKGAAVDQAKSVSSAIQQTAEGLGDNAPAWLKSAFSQGAQQIQRFADSIEHKDSRQLMSEAQSFARQNPATFLAACAAAGFAAARLLKAGGPSDGSRAAPAPSAQRELDDNPMFRPGAGAQSSFEPSSRSSPGALA